MLSAAWRGWLLFHAPAGLPALLFVSQQGLWEWSGEQLLVTWKGPFCLSLMIVKLPFCSVQGIKRRGRAAVWKGSHWPCGCSHMCNADVYWYYNFNYSACP